MIPVIIYLNFPMPEKLYTASRATRIVEHHVRIFGRPQQASVDYYVLSLKVKGRIKAEFISHTLSVAFTFTPLALLNKNNRAAP